MSVSLTARGGHWSVVFHKYELVFFLIIYFLAIKIESAKNSVCLMTKNVRVLRL